MTRISIAQAYEPVEVDLWGTVFETADVTRSGQKKAQALEGELEGTEDPDEQVELLAKLLDLKLVSTNGTKLKPSTMIVKKWKADELSPRSLFSFLDRLAEAETRPT